MSRRIASSGSLRPVQMKSSVAAEFSLQSTSGISATRRPLAYEAQAMTRFSGVAGAGSVMRQGRTGFYRRLSAPAVTVRSWAFRDTHRYSSRARRVGDVLHHSTGAAASPVALARVEAVTRLVGPRQPSDRDVHE